MMTFNSMPTLNSNLGVVVMDGSMGRLLVNKGLPEDTRIWSAIALVEEKYHPMVVEAHREYIQAGATLITTSNYGVQPTYYRRAFDDWEARIPSDCELAAKLAVQARAECDAEDRVKILGSLPPLVESFRPDLAAKFMEDEGRDFCIRTYRGIAEALIRGGADILIAETMNSWEEAQLVIEAVRDLGLPLMVSMQGALLGKEDLKPKTHLAPAIAEQLLKAKAAGTPIISLCFNCAPPEQILECLDAIHMSKQGAALEAAGVTLAAYANVSVGTHTVGEFVYDMGEAASLGKGVSPATILREDMRDNGYVKFCRSFIRKGARCCGGCCSTTPDDIRALCQSLEADSRAELALDVSSQERAPKRFRAERTLDVASRL